MLLPHIHQYQEEFKHYLDIGTKNKIGLKKRIDNNESGDKKENNENDQPEKNQNGLFRCIRIVIIKHNYNV
jgi:hypothetical protein